MEIIRLKTKMLSQKVIANVSDEMARVYDLPEGHQSVGFFSVDNDDAGYLAVDDATKKADIKVIRAETFYAGRLGSWSRYGGSVFVMISGPKVADVKSGLAYAKDFIDNRTELCCLMAIRARRSTRSAFRGPESFFGISAGIEEGTAYAYLVGGPIETNYALDKALKAGETRIARYWYPPSHANSSGAVLAGTESACRAAAQAFVEGAAHAIEHPMEI